MDVRRKLGQPIVPQGPQIVMGDASLYNAVSAPPLLALPRLHDELQFITTPSQKEEPLTKRLLREGDDAPTPLIRRVSSQDLRPKEERDRAMRGKEREEGNWLEELRSLSKAGPSEFISTSPRHPHPSISSPKLTWRLTPAPFVTQRAREAASKSQFEKMTKEALEQTNGTAVEIYRAHFELRRIFSQLIKDARESEEGAVQGDDVLSDVVGDRRGRSVVESLTEKRKWLKKFDGRFFGSEEVGKEIKTILRVKNWEERLKGEFEGKKERVKTRSAKEGYKPRIRRIVQDFFEGPVNKNSKVRRYRSGSRQVARRVVPGGRKGRTGIVRAYVSGFGLRRGVRMHRWTQREGRSAGRRRKVVRYVRRPVTNVRRVEAASARERVWERRNRVVGNRMVVRPVVSTSPVRQRGRDGEKKEGRKRVGMSGKVKRREKKKLVEAVSGWLNP